MLAGLRTWQGSIHIETRRGAEVEDDNDGRALFNRMQLMSGRVFLTRKEPNRNTEKRTECPPSGGEKPQYYDYFV